jgi:hypothetical protein
MVARQLSMGGLEAYSRISSQGVADGREGVAKLVGEHGHEVVLVLVGLLQCGFGAHDVFDIGGRADPGHDLAGGVTHRAAASQEPAILSVGGAKAVAVLPGAARPQGLLPERSVGRVILGMHHIDVLVAQQLFPGMPGVLGINVVHVREPARGIVAEDDVRESVRHDAEALFAGPQGLLRLHAGRQIERRPHARDRLAGTLEELLFGLFPARDVVTDRAQNGLRSLPSLQRAHRNRESMIGLLVEQLLFSLPAPMSLDVGEPHLLLEPAALRGVKRLDPPITQQSGIEAEHLAAGGILPGCVLLSCQGRRARELSTGK